MNPNIIIRSPHLELHDKTREEIAQIAEKLFRHNMNISRLKMTVDKTIGAETHKAFAVRLTVEMRGPDISVLGEREHLLPAAHHAIDLAERQLNERMRSMDAKRHHPHPVELDAEIPKATRN